jgi:hypothetical protein
MNYQNWKDLLRLLKLRHMELSTPSAFIASGGYTMKVKGYTDKDANGLTRCIEDYINFLPDGLGQATRMNSTGVPRQMNNGEIKWSKSNTRKGVADIIGSYKGRFLSIEVKIGRDVQSEAQIKEQARIEQTGGLYFIAKDFPSFLLWWEQQGFPIPKNEFSESVKGYK